MLGRNAGRAVAHEVERAVLFGLIEVPSRRSLAVAALRRWALALPIALLVVLGAPAAAAWANTYLVSNGNDSGTGSLRAAIQLANSHTGPNTITTAPGVGTLTVTLQSALPQISHEVLMNFIEGNPDQPLVINNNGQKYGLILAPGSSGSTLEGVTSYGATQAGVIAESSDNQIYYFFAHNDGTHGLVVQSNNDSIQNDTFTANSGPGIELQGPSSGAITGNLLLGNLIGTNSAGDSGLGNLGGGILLLGNTSSNTIGGTAAGDGNVISGNNAGGVLLNGGSVTGNLVEGNTIGLTPSGSAALPNQWGVKLTGGTGNDTFSINTVAGNSGGGIQINGGGTIQLQGNYIGTDSAGDSGLGNSGDGIVVEGSGSLDLIGGSAAGDGNVISGNHGYGVLFTGGGLGENTLQGNVIGTTPSASAAQGNAWGVGITGGAVNDTLTANVISGNTHGGVLLNGSGTSGNQLLGNYIGTNPSGAALGNGNDGVLIDGGATGNTLGGSQASQGNQIGFNLGGGVFVSGSSTTGDVLLSNLIFSSGPNRSGPGIKLIAGGDGGQGAPRISSITPAGGTQTMINGTGAPSATVQTFGNGSCSDPEGKTLLGTAHADSGGNWSMLVPAIQHGTGVTAAQTTASSESSPFSSCVSSP